MIIGLLTQHGKETLLAPLFRTQIGATLVRVTGFDTDSLGTFTRTVPRVGSQIQAATKKAELALALSDAAYGLGSEGAFHPDPQLHLLPWNTEILVLIHRQTRQAITALAQGRAQSYGFSAHSWEDVVAQLPKTGFPAHHLIVRAADAHGALIAQGIKDPETLHATCVAALQNPAHAGVIYLENDLRAHANPTRQGIIQNAAHELLRRYQALCPSCQARGWGTTRTEPGAPCRDCGAPTRHPQGAWWTCSHCGHEILEAYSSTTPVDPGHCDRCNP